MTFEDRLRALPEPFQSEILKHVTRLGPRYEPAEPLTLVEPLLEEFEIAGRMLIRAIGSRSTPTPESIRDRLQILHDLGASTGSGYLQVRNDLTASRWQAATQLARKYAFNLEIREWALANVGLVSTLPFSDPLEAPPSGQRFHPIALNSEGVRTAIIDIAEQMLHLARTIDIRGISDPFPSDPSQRLRVRARLAFNRADLGPAGESVRAIVVEGAQELAHVWKSLDSKTILGVDAQDDDALQRLAETELVYSAVQPALRTIHSKRYALSLIHVAAALVPESDHVNFAERTHDLAATQFGMALS